MPASKVKPILVLWESDRPVSTSTPSRPHTSDPKSRPLPTTPREWDEELENCKVVDPARIYQIIALWQKDLRLEKTPHCSPQKAPSSPPSPPASPLVASPPQSPQPPQSSLVPTTTTSKRLFSAAFEVVGSLEESEEKN